MEPFKRRVVKIPNPFCEMQAPGQKMKLSQLVSKVESALAPEARPDDVRSVLISKASMAGAHAS